MLTEAEYREIMQRRVVMQGIIEGAERDEDKYDDMKKAAHANKVDCEARLSLYTNHLQSAIDEYEAANPPENP